MRNRTTADQRQRIALWEALREDLLVLEEALISSDSIQARLRRIRRRLLKSLSAVNEVSDERLYSLPEVQAEKAKKLRSGPRNQK